MACTGSLGLAIALAFFGVPSAQRLPPAEPPGPHAQPLPSPDFVAAASQSDQFEREEGRLAAMRALDGRVRALASAMVREHARSTRLVQAAARRSGLPSPPPGLDLGQQQEAEALKATTGPAFDHAYVDQQVRAHLRALSLMTSYIQSGPPGPLRQAALQIRPIVSRHLAAFERLQAGLR